MSKSLDLTNPANMKLIHKSRKYADRIMEKINEETIREIVFECWVEAYAEGYDLGRRAEREYHPSNTEMGQ